MTRVKRPALAVLVAVLFLVACQWLTPNIGLAAEAPLLPDISNAEWLVLGPFDNSASSEPFANCVGYDSDYLLEIGGEAAARPVQGGRVVGKTWRPVRAAGGTIDFESVFPNQDYKVAYAYLKLESDHEQPAALRIGSDDGIKVWLNGALVWANHAHRALLPDQDAVRINLQKGTNHLLVKVDDGYGEWAFSARLRSLDEEHEHWSKTTSKALGIHLFDVVSSDPSEIVCMPVTVPASAVELPVQVVAYSAANEELGRVEAVTGERVTLSISPDYAGPLILRAKSEDPGFAETSAVALVGDSSSLARDTADMARRVAAGLDPVDGRCEDPATTLLFLADQLEGKVYSGLVTPERQLMALTSISEICAALESGGSGEWQVGRLTGLRQWAYRSKIDGSIQPYSVYLPYSYDPSKEYGLIVTLHGYSANDRDAASSLAAQAPDDFIVVAPYGRGDIGYRSIGEQDVFDVMEMAEETYPIDPDRVYLTGSSMGGLGAWRIGIFYADRFAAMAPFCGWTSTWHLVNLRNLPVLIVHGGNDTSVPVEFSRAAAAALKDLGYNYVYEELPGVGHDAWSGLVDSKGGQYLFDFFRQHKRNLWPAEIFFTTDYLRYGKHYWVQIEELDLGMGGAIRARIVDRLVQVATSGVTAFSLDLRHPALSGYSKVAVAIDNTVLGAETGRERVVFEKVGDEWVEATDDLPAGTVRHTGGGLADLFVDPVVFVYGTAVRERTGVLKRAAESYADWAPNSYISVGSTIGRFPVVADTETSLEELAGKNIVLFGTPDQNRILASLAGELPVKFHEGGLFEFDGQAFLGVGLIMVYPNPQSPSNLVGVFSLPFSESELDSYFFTANLPFRAYNFGEMAVSCAITPDVMLYGSMIMTPRVWVFDRLWQNPVELVW